MPKRETKGVELETMGRASDRDNPSQPLMNRERNPRAGKIASYYDQMVYWLQRRSIPRSIFLSLILRQRDLLTAEERSHIPSRLRLSFWLQGYAIPLENRQVHAMTVDSFLRGFNSFTERWWTPTFLSLLLRDIIYYSADSQNIFSNALWRIVLMGQSRDPKIWTAAMKNHWWLPSILVGIPTLFGSCEAVKRYRWHRRGYLSNQDKQAVLTEALHAYDDCVAKWGRDVWKWLMPGTSLKRSLEQAEASLLWYRNSHHFNNRVRGQLIENIRILARSGRRLTGLYALSTLGRLIDGLHERDVSWIKRQISNVGDSSSYRHLEDIISSMIGTLFELAYGKHESHLLWRQDRDNDESVIRNSFVKRLYTNYLLWSLGRSQNRWLEPLFWSYKIILLYTKIRFWMTFIQSMVINSKRTWNWYDAKRQCEQASKRWVETIRGIHECTVCGDWPEVYYLDIFESQSCLDAVLRHSQTPSRLLEALMRVQPFGVQHVDLSAQNWDTWTSTNLEMILNATSLASVDQQLELFNLSCRIPSRFPLDSEQVLALAHFFKAVTIQNLDFCCRGMDANATTVLLPQMTTYYLSALNLSGNPIGKKGVETIAWYLPAMFSLKVLNLSDNHLSNSDLAVLAPALRNTSINELTLCGNQFSQEGLTVLSDYLPQNLSVLDLSRNDFFDVELKSLGQALARIPIRTLTFRNTHLNDQQLWTIFSFLGNSTVEVADFSENHFTPLAMKDLQLRNTPLRVLILSNTHFGDLGLAYLAPALRNSSITELDISDSEISDTGAIVLSDFLSEMKVRVLIVSGNHISEIGMGALASVLPNTMVNELILARNNLGDNGVEELSQELIHHSNPVRKIDVSENHITLLGALSLAGVLGPRTQVTHLILKGNTIGDAGARAIINALKGNTTVFVDFNHCGLSDNSISALAKQLPDIGLQGVDFGYNDITSEGALTIAQVLVKPTPEKEILWDTTLNRKKEQTLAQAVPNTQLTSFILSFNDVNASGARALCRVLPSAGIKMVDIDLTGNPIDPNQVNIHSCCSSDGKRVEVPFLIAWMYASTQKILPNQAKITELFNRCYQGVQGVYAWFSQAWQVRQSTLHMPTMQETLFLSSGVDHVVIPHQKGCVTIHGFDRSDRLHLPYVPVITMDVSNLCQTVSCDQAVCAKVQFADMEIRVTGVTCEQLAKQTDCNEPESFAKVLSSVMNDASQGFLNGNAFSYLIAITLAFRQEVCGFVLTYLPGNLRSVFSRYRSYPESVLLNDLVEFALRSQHGGAKTLIHDGVVTVKSACRQKHCDDLHRVKSSQQTTSSKWTEKVQEAASGLLALGATYGAVLAINALTGNSLIGYLVMPCIVNGKQIVCQTMAGYRRYGLFGALDAGVEALAFSVPGGRVIARTLSECH